MFYPFNTSSIDCVSVCDKKNQNNNNQVSFVFSSLIGKPATVLAATEQLTKVRERKRRQGILKSELEFGISRDKSSGSVVRLLVRRGAPAARRVLVLLLLQRGAPGGFRFRTSSPTTTTALQNAEAVSSLITQNATAAAAAVAVAAGLLSSRRTLSPPPPPPPPSPPRVFSRHAERYRRRRRRRRRRRGSSLGTQNADAGSSLISHAASRSIPAWRRRRRRRRSPSPSPPSLHAWQKRYKKVQDMDPLGWLNAAASLVT